MAPPDTNVIEVHYEGFSKALNGLLLEDRTEVIYRAICRKEDRVTFRTKINDEMASLVDEAINYFCIPERFHTRFYEAAHLAVETDQKDIARSILVKALRNEQTEDEKYVNGDVGASPKYLE